MSHDSVRVAVTGIGWMGGGIGSIESAIDLIFRQARLEITVTAYAIGTGSDVLFEWLEIALSRSVKVTTIINHFHDQPAIVCDQFHGLVRIYPYFHVYDFAADGQSDLHAKVIVADRSRAIVGSSNLSKRGFLTNYELALAIEGPTVSAIAMVIDRLLSNKNVTRISSLS